MIQTIKVIATGRVENIDNTPPNITGISAQASTADTSVTVALKAQDAESGITKIEWQCKKNGDEWTTSADEKSKSGDKGTGDLGDSFSHKFGDLDEGTEYTFQAVVHNAADDQTAISEPTNANTIIKGITPTVENIGDYVNYPIDINGNSTTTDDWRVFYVGQQEDGDARGRIFLIAADYVAHTCSALSTALTASGMKKYQNTNYRYETFYWSRFPDYHCNDKHNKQLNSNKAQCSFPELFMPANTYCDAQHRYFCSDHTSYVNSRCASRLQCTEDWNSFVEEEYADYAIGGPTLNMWVESWNTKHGTKRKLYANGQGNGYGYYVGTTPSTDDYYQDLSSFASGDGDTLYFPHQSLYYDLDNDGLEEICYGYWLASPSANDSDYLMDAGYNCRVGMCNYDNTSFGLRPAVCLSSGAKLRDCEAETCR